MKKVLLSISLLASAVFVNAQTLTQLNHTPFAFDAPFTTNQCDSTNISPGASGSGATWSYTPIVHNSIANTYITSFSSNGAFNPADAVVSSASNASYYITTSTTKLSYYGGNISINGFVGVVKYASPAIVAIYPMSLNTTTTSTTNGTITLSQPFPVTAAFNGNCTTTADASGTLALPTRTFTNILRLATTQNLIATGTATINLLTYDYYAVGSSRSPILTIQTSTLTSSFGSPSSQTVTTLQKNYTTVGVKETKSSKQNVSVYPNPASGQLNISVNGVEVSTISILDLTGKTVYTEPFDGVTKSINVSQLNEGIYFYNILDKEYQVTATGKFNISR